MLSLWRFTTLQPPLQSFDIKVAIPLHVVPLAAAPRVQSPPPTRAESPSRVCGTLSDMCKNECD